MVDTWPCSMLARLGMSFYTAQKLGCLYLHWFPLQRFRNNLELRCDEGEAALLEIKPNFTVRPIKKLNSMCCLGTWVRSKGCPAISKQMNCKSLLCSMFNKQTCSRFTWLFVRLFVRHNAQNIFENFILLFF